MRAATTPQVVLFTTGPSCSLCGTTHADLVRLAGLYPFRLEVRDLAVGAAPSPDYVFRVPVVHIDGRLVAEGRIETSTLEAALGAAVRARSVERRPGEALIRRRTPHPPGL